MKNFSTFSELLNWLKIEHYKLDNVKCDSEFKKIKYLEDRITAVDDYWLHQMYDRGKEVWAEKLNSEKEAVERFKRITKDFKSIEYHTIGFSFSKALHEELIDILKKRKIDYKSSTVLLPTHIGKRNSYYVKVRLSDITKTENLKERYIDGRADIEK